RKKTPARKAAAKKRPAAKATKPKTKRKTALNQLSYPVSEELASIIGVSKATRPQIIQKLWIYIKANGCQDAKKRRMIVPDRKLALVLGNKPIDMLKMAGLLNKHIKKAS
ncbi:MAG TPA: SWIB/MDM2 domain-containing protein, partial [Chlamydiales bacterium]|nr:SWIB/MDM2 domain-containing protein [Chlamydiales bacterium]